VTTDATVSGVQAELVACPSKNQAIVLVGGEAGECRPKTCRRVNHDAELKG
jgi:hypothetical protein